MEKIYPRRGRWPASGSANGTQAPKQIAMILSWAKRFAMNPQLMFLSSRRFPTRTTIRTPQTSTTILHFWGKEIGTSNVCIDQSLKLGCRVQSNSAHTSDQFACQSSQPSVIISLRSKLWVSPVGVSWFELKHHTTNRNTCTFLMFLQVKPKKFLHRTENWRWTLMASRIQTARKFTAARIVKSSDRKVWD